MFGIILTPRGSPATRRHARSRSGQPLPATGDDGPARPRAAGRRHRPGSGGPPESRSPGLRIFEPKSRRPRKADIERARRLLAADLTYIAHPSFDDPAARDAILAPATGFEGPGRDPTPADDGADGGPSPEGRIPSREQEAHRSAR